MALKFKKKSRSDEAQDIGSGSGKLGRVLLILLVLAFAATAGVFYKKYKDVKANPGDAISEKNTVETNRVLDALKKRILITDTSAPTVARVEDPEKLKTSNAEFYKDIQKGDYLIVYPKRLIVYRESADQIINIAPIINTADLQSQQQNTQTQQQTEQKKN